MRQGATVVAAVVVVATLATVWAVGGVVLDEGLRAVAFEFAFVAAPGVALFAVIDERGRSPMRTLALGYALGCALEVAAFSATAAMGLRPLFLAYPVAVVLPASVVLYRRRRRQGGGAHPDVAVQPATTALGPPITAGVQLGLAVSCALAIAYMALGAFPVLPRPGSVAGVSYPSDSVLDVAYTVDVVHHWPISRPWISGSPVDYHWLVFAHTGGMVQVTGLDPAWVIFRLVSPLLLIGAIGLTFVAGWTLSGRQRVGAVAAALLFLCGEIDLVTSSDAPFAGWFRDELWASPTFLFGLVLFLAALTLLWEQLDPVSVRRPRAWIALVPVLIVGAGSKSTVLPVLLGGVILYAAWRSLHRRRIDERSGATVLAVGACMAVAWLLFFRGVTGSYARISPLASLSDTPFWQNIVAPANLGHALVPLAWVAVAAALLAPLCGALALLWRRRLEPAQALLLGLFVAAFAAFNLVEIPGLAQIYFLNYGYAAGACLSAWGLELALSRLAGHVRLCSFVVALVALATGALVGVIAHASRLPGTFPDQWKPAYIAFAAVLAGVALVALVVGRLVGPAMPALAVATLGVVVATAALQPGVELWTTARAVMGGTSVYTADGPDSRGLTVNLLRGLTWIRDNTPTDAVLAVDSHYVNPADDDAKYHYFTAFAERRVVLESWDDTAEWNQLALEGRPDDQPFPERWRLNERVFAAADRAGAQALRTQYGVTLLVEDRVHVSSSPGVAALGRLIYSNSAIAVYALS